MSVASSSVNSNLFHPTEEHQLLRQTVREFVKNEIEPQAALFDEKEEFNLDLFRKLGALGLLGITVPEQYGGSGMDAVAAVIAHEEISWADPGFALAYLAHAMLCANNISVNASEEQKKRVLPKLCSGEWVGAMGLSEPHAGTDVLGMKTTAKKDGDGYVINGRKMWITNGAVDEQKTPCDCLLLYAVTGEGGGAKNELTTFLVERGVRGFSVGQKITGKTGMRASNTAELCFDSCRVEGNARVGDEGGALSHMMRNLEIERLTLAAMSLGIALRSLDVMVRYSTERTAFGKTLDRFGQIQRYIGESFAELQAARTYVYHTAGRMNLHDAGHRLDSDGVKLFAAPVAKRIADRAIQTLGGYGYVQEYVVERLWRDAKLLEIGGGTIESHQKNITKDLVKNGFSR
jgi:isovaleryl-CoA dehydrogenase